MIEFNGYEVGNIRIAKYQFPPMSLTDRKIQMIVGEGERLQIRWLLKEEVAELAKIFKELAEDQNK